MPGGTRGSVRVDKRSTGRRLGITPLIGDAKGCTLRSVRGPRDVIREVEIIVNKAVKAAKAVKEAQAPLTDVAFAAARHARFGKLPERVRFEDMTEEVEAAPAGVTAYNPEGEWQYYSCLALDLGL